MRRVLPWLLVAALAACGRKGTSNRDFDSAVAAALAPPPGSPTDPTSSRQSAHVMSFDVGHQIDKNGRILGGVGGQFATSDTVVASITVQYGQAGDRVAARLQLADRTMDSVTAPLPAPDSTHTSTVGVTFHTDKPWPKGTYRLEVFLGNNSAGFKDFKITQ